MPRRVEWCCGLAIVALLVGVPLWYSSYSQAQQRMFRVVHEGVLYRSAQLPLAGLKQVIHDYKIKTVVSLRDSYTVGEKPPDAEEEAYCRAQELNYVRITPQRWEADIPDTPPPVDKGIRTFREIVADPANQPVLVHCFAGIHRTGAYVAIYRMEQEHWSNADAIAELKASGYSNLDDELDILSYLEHYRATWRTDSELPLATATSPSVPAEKRRPKKGHKHAAEPACRGQ